MADIHIEKKNKPVWPWILGILLVIGVVWLVVELVDTNPKGMASNEQVITTDQNKITEEGVIDEQIGISTEDEQNNQQQGSQDSLSQGQNTSGTSSFVSYIEDTNVKENLGKDHQVTGEALMKLSTALKDLSEDNSYQQSIDKIQQDAQQIQRNPQSLKHADMVKDAFTNAANVMGQIQEQKFPATASEVKDVQKASDQVQVEEPLLDQKQAVDNFFDEAVQALEKMQNEKETQDQQPS